MLIGVPWFVWVAFGIYAGLLFLVEYLPSLKKIRAEVEQFQAEMGQQEPKQEQQENITPRSWRLDP